MRTTTNHSWSPRDLLTHLHAQQSCASRSWIGHKACASTWRQLARHSYSSASHLSFPQIALPSLASFCLQNHLPSSALYSATMLHPSSGHSAIRMSFCRSAYNFLPQSRALWMWLSAGDIHGSDRSTLPPQVSWQASIECMATRGFEWALNSLTHGFWGITRNTLSGQKYHPRAFGPWAVLSAASGISHTPTEAMG